MTRNVRYHPDSHSRLRRVCIYTYRCIYVDMYSSTRSYLRFIGTLSTPQVVIRLTAPAWHDFRLRQAAAFGTDFSLLVADSSLRDFINPSPARSPARLTPSPQTAYASCSLTRWPAAHRVSPLPGTQPFLPRLTQQELLHGESNAGELIRRSQYRSAACGRDSRKASRVWRACIVGRPNWAT